MPGGGGGGLQLSCHGNDIAMGAQAKRLWGFPARPFRLGWPWYTIKSAAKAVAIFAWRAGPILLEREAALFISPRTRGELATYKMPDGSLDVDGQRCSKCENNFYIIDQLHSCIKCPEGASCPDGVQFVSNVADSEWEEERVTNGGLQRRIASCPAGYKMQRKQAIPDTDACVKCIEGKYRLEPVRWQGPDAILPECFPCPTGATCSGGNNVEASKGYWRLQMQLAGDYEYLDVAADVCKTADDEGSECLFPAGYHLLGEWQDAPMHCTNLPEVSSGLVCARKASGSRRAAGATGTSTAALFGILAIVPVSRPLSTGLPSDRSSFSPASRCLQLPLATPPAGTRFFLRTTSQPTNIKRRSVKKK